MNNTIEIDLGFAKLLVTKNDGFREVYVGLRTDKGDYQDLAIIGQTQTVRNGEDVFADSVHIRVFADEECEDYTDSFIVGLANEFK